MARQVTKAASNRYCQARLEAAKCNDRLASREGASEELGCVSEDCLKKYELDITKPPNDAVAIMAETYNSPELAVWYCANECPLGRWCREVPEMPPERTYIRLTNTLDKLDSSMKELAEILDDGKITADETATALELWDEFLEARRRIDETLAILEKVQKTGKEV